MKVIFVIGLLLGNPAKAITYSGWVKAFSGVITSQDGNAAYQRAQVVIHGLARRSCLGAGWKDYSIHKPEGSIHWSRSSCSYDVDTVEDFQLREVPRVFGRGKHEYMSMEPQLIYVKEYSAWCNAWYRCHK